MSSIAMQKTRAKKTRVYSAMLGNSQRLRLANGAILKGGPSESNKV
jgi:hypothetical protein